MKRLTDDEIWDYEPVHPGVPKRAFADLRRYKAALEMSARKNAHGFDDDGLGVALPDCWCGGCIAIRALADDEEGKE